MKEITYYYTDELNDEFSGVERESVVVDENFAKTCVRLLQMLVTA
jgi:hypothetical protein